MTFVFACTFGDIIGICGHVLYKRCASANKENSAVLSDGPYQTDDQIVELDTNAAYGHIKWIVHNQR